MQIRFASGLTRLTTLLIIGASMAGCGGGPAVVETAAVSQTPPVVAPPSPGAPASTPDASPSIPDASQANRAPSIQGAAITTVTAGQGYSFQPSAIDADGDALQFFASSIPSWASLDAATGRLSGVPTDAQAGSYEEIEISVSDGSLTAKLAPFSITVMPGAPRNRAVTVSWQPPTVNDDGTTLTNLSGYRIVYGDKPGVYSKSVDVTSAGLTRHLVENLSTGRYYFAMVALNSDGAESELSAEVSIDLS